MSNSRLVRIALTLGILALLIFIVDRLWTFGQFIGPVVSHWLRRGSSRFW